MDLDNNEAERNSLKNVILSIEGDIASWELNLQQWE
jgi:hypothetical protein